MNLRKIKNDPQMTKMNNKPDGLNTNWDTRLLRFTGFTTPESQFLKSDAWQNWWDNAEQSDKNKILDCKYFDAEIFKGITGLEIEKEKSIVGSEAIVEVGGKKYKAKIVSEE